MLQRIDLIIYSGCLLNSFLQVIAWGRQKFIKDVEALLEPAVRFMTYYENYTGINYPYSELSKSSHI